MTDQSSSPKSSKDTAALMWILAIFFSFISSAYFYITKKDDKLVHEESKLALNLSINCAIVFIAISIFTTIISFIASFLSLIGMLLMLGAFLVWAYICYLHSNAVKENLNKPQIPYVIMFIK